MKVHESITESRVIEAIRRREECLDNPGFCVACGEEMDGCEPDARRYKCECCGERTVYGAEEFIMEGFFNG